MAKLCFPGLAPNAATWLANERKIHAVGIDTASIDKGKSKDFAAHVNLMTHNIPAFENAANLDKLPARGAYVVVLPVKIRGGSRWPAAYHRTPHRGALIPRLNVEGSGAAGKHQSPGHS